MAGNAEECEKACKHLEENVSAKDLKGSKPVTRTTNVGLRYIQTISPPCTFGLYIAGVELEKPMVSLIGYAYDENKQKGKLFSRNCRHRNFGETNVHQCIKVLTFKNINKISITKASEEVSYALLQASLLDRSTGGDLKGN
ncbi:hypothetical protein D8674_041228 [Pyrus ussuriensis x Pyrus communis]|uniref:Uncharacterized protein n=1 Tax=Pyrus ussuriensis x Pyrus communis TaxID=2448454 RepID=A0A5N5HD37_9ROSA|nr:hypothetical protein D8674_041228 [Pyrus ussuriensis x Pyrus communis]